MNTNPLLQSKIDKLGIEIKDLEQHLSQLTDTLNNKKEMLKEFIEIAEGLKSTTPNIESHKYNWGIAKDLVRLLKEANGSSFTIRELSEKSGYEKASVTNSANELARKGVVIKIKTNDGINHYSITVSEEERAMEKVMNNAVADIKASLNGAIKPDEHNDPVKERL